MRNADPGSDLQLAWARCYIGAANGDDHLRRVQHWFEGTRPIKGLVIDTALRWQLLRKLVAFGLPATPRSRPSSNVTSTSMGEEEHAAACRALRPTAAAKAEAWQQLMERDDIPNAMQGAIISGFAARNQRELAQPYVDDYFSVIASLWEQRTPSMARMLVNGLYPGLLASDDSSERTDAFLAAGERLARHGAHPARTCDGVARALRAQALRSSPSRGANSRSRRSPMPDRLPIPLERLLGGPPHHRPRPLRRRVAPRRASLHLPRAARDGRRRPRRSPVRGVHPRRPAVTKWPPRRAAADVGNGCDRSRPMGLRARERPP